MTKILISEYKKISKNINYYQRYENNCELLSDLYFIKNFVSLRVQCSFEC